MNDDIQKICKYAQVNNKEHSHGHEYRCKHAILSQPNIDIYIYIYIWFGSNELEVNSCKDPKTFP